MRSFVTTTLLYGAVLGASLDLNHNALQARQSTVKTVNTTSGPVSGHLSSNASLNVAEYLGIPFAAPPVGNLRFAPPQKYNGTTAINGTNFGFSCPSTAIQTNLGNTSVQSLNFAAANVTAVGLQYLSILGQIADRFSEDCLTLNVWVPSGGESSKAVLLWIYGGGFNTGSTSTSTYNGQILANEQDVIVVSINYRLNIFGFPGNPSIPQLNPGLLDQRLGVEWVRDNIANFGGDPKRITLFGQSAGSASIDYYTYAWTAEPIINGAIMESGVIGFGGQSTNASSAASSWFTVSQNLGCGNSSSDQNAVLACMRTKSYTDIINAFPITPASTSALGIFNPTIDNITVFADYASRAAAGNFIKVPLLIGNTNNESSLFRILGELRNMTAPDAYWNTFTLVGFTCPAATRSNVSVSKGVPTWRYRYFGDWPDLQLSSDPRNQGAYHTAELPLVFGTLPAAGGGVPNVTDQELAVAQYIRGAWGAFAKNPGSGLDSYGWPRYSPSANNTLVRLAYNNQSGTNVGDQRVYDAGCGSVFAVNGTGNGTSGTGTASGGGGASGTTGAPATATSSVAAAQGLRNGVTGVVVGGLAFAWLLL